MDVLKVVDKVSEILNMSVHHFDHRDFPKGYLTYLNTDYKPIVVAYSDKYSPWCFAIMEDFSVVIPTLNLLKVIENLSKKLAGKTDQNFDEELAMLSSISFAEEFLRNSPDSEVLKIFNPKILTYYYE